MSKLGAHRSNTRLPRRDAVGSPSPGLALSAAARRTLRALTECVIQDAPHAAQRVDSVVEDVVARLDSLHAYKRQQLLLALFLLGNRVLVLFAIGRFAPFHALSAIDRARCFAACGDSRLPKVRASHQAFRRLILATHYADEKVSSAIGYRGPLHSRQPAVLWEGPLAAGITRDDEPVARGGAIAASPPGPQSHAQEIERRIVMTDVTAPRAAPANVISADAIAPNSVRNADVIVIGTGAGGAVAASRLADNGFQVVLIEEGDYMRSEDFTEREAQLTERLYAEGGLRGTDDLSVMILQGRTVGGSTTVNWMIMLRTPDYVLDEWATQHGVHGFSRDEMAPVFDRIEREVHARVVPDDAHSPNNKLILDGARALGWRASSATINAKGCVRSGFCGVGCRYDAKQGTLTTFVPRALAKGATLITGARVEHIAITERDTGHGTPPLKRVTARAIDRENATHGRTFTVDAPIVVLAAGAVGTPVLLQRSSMGGDGVGQWLRLHPTTAVIGMYDREIGASTGIPLSTMCDEFIQWNNTNYGFWIECPPMQPSLAAVATQRFGAEHARDMVRFQQTGSFIALTRDGAEQTRSNGAVTTDRRGRVHIDYALGAQDAERVRASVEAAARLHLAAGAESVRTLHSRPVVIKSERDLGELATRSIGPNEMALFSAHVNGTCRMGLDPRTSGATPDGERHGVRGLYIADGSLLPTSLGVNPQETIMALSSVIAERIAVRHRVS